MYFLSLSLCNISILVPAEIPINFVTWCAHLRQPIACLDGRSLAQLQAAKPERSIYDHPLIPQSVSFHQITFLRRSHQLFNSMGQYLKLDGTLSRSTSSSIIRRAGPRSICFVSPLDTTNLIRSGTNIPNVRVEKRSPSTLPLAESFSAYVPVPRISRR